MGSATSPRPACPARYRHSLADEVLACPTARLPPTPKNCRRSECFAVPIPTAHADMADLDRQKTPGRACWDACWRPSRIRAGRQCLPVRIPMWQDCEGCHQEFDPRAFVPKPIGHPEQRAELNDKGPMKKPCYLFP